MTDSGGTYGGLPGAFPYAFRASDSRVFRAYLLVGGGAALLVAAIVVTGVVSLVGRTAGVPGGTFTLSRAFYAVVGLLVFAPVVAPVLLVARRHRTGGATPRYDAALGAAGFGVLLSLYAGLVVSVPPEHQEPASGLLAPVARALYATPQELWFLPPVLGALGVYLAHRFAG